MVWCRFSFGGISVGGYHTRVYAANDYAGPVYLTAWLWKSGAPPQIKGKWKRINLTLQKSITNECVPTSLLFSSVIGPCEYQSIN